MTDPRAVALVTGASSGIGRSASVALANAGFDVVINYSRNKAGANETAALAQAAGASTLVYKCDVAEDAEVKAMLAATKDTFGRLDALINSAGITVDTPPKAMDDLDVEDWNRVFAVNVLGIFLVTRAAAPMLRESHGAIVNTNSVAGLRPAVQPLPYAASKAAVANLTKTLTTALGPEIRVNGVAPG
jgi:3-oxoacyl-[acyl-carrier protein] reductase